MKKKYKTIAQLLIAGALIGFGSPANALLLSSFDYTGDLTITDFITTETDNISMTFTWVIDENAGNSHSIIHSSASSIPTVVGTSKIFDSILGEIELGTDFLVPFAEILPDTAGSTVNFPSGIGAPGVLETGDPLFSILIQRTIFGTVIDSDLNVNKVTFIDNEVTMDLVESINPGGINDPARTAFGTILNNFSPDGVFTRRFAIDAIVSGEPAAVPVPAAFWLFGTGLIGLVAKRKKAA